MPVFLDIFFRDCINMFIPFKILKKVTSSMDWLLMVRSILIGFTGCFWVEKIIHLLIYFNFREVRVFWH